MLHIHNTNGIGKTDAVYFIYYPNNNYSFTPPSETPAIINFDKQK